MACVLLHVVCVCVCVTLPLSPHIQPNLALTNPFTLFRHRNAARCARPRSARVFILVLGRGGPGSCGASRWVSLVYQSAVSRPEIHSRRSGLTSSDCTTTSPNPVRAFEASLKSVTFGSRPASRHNRVVGSGRKRSNRVVIVRKYTLYVTLGSARLPEIPFLART